MTGDALADRFRVVSVDSVPLRAVTIRRRESRREAWSAELGRMARALAERYERDGRPLLTLDDGTLPPLHRLESVTTSAAGMEIVTSPTDYAEFLLTNVEHPEWRSERGDEVMADPIGLSAVLHTADGLVLYGLRSGRTHDSPGGLHVLPSGHPHPPDSLWDAVGAELADETGLSFAEVDDARVTGIARADGTGKPEVTVRLRSTVSSAEVLGRWSGAVERWEFDELRTLAWTPDTVARWLGDHVRTCVAPGLAAIALAGRLDFGDSWYESVVPTPAN